MSVGIQRTRIVSPLSGRGKARFAWAEARHAAANRLYRLIFERLHMPLLPGESDVVVTLAERQGQLDSALGIDVTLFLANGMSYMLQEKFLSRTFLTVTVEYENDPLRGLPGDWLHCQASCYFVGYDRSETCCFSEWILLDWPRVKQLTAQNRIPWSDPRANGRDGAKATFRWVDFSKIPSECVMHGVWNRCEHIGAETYSLEMWHTLEAQLALFPETEPAAPMPEPPAPEPMVFVPPPPWRKPEQLGLFLREGNDDVARITQRHNQRRRRR